MRTTSSLLETIQKRKKTFPRVYGTLVQESYTSFVVTLFQILNNSWKENFFFFFGFNVNKMDVNSKWIWSPPLETNFHEQCSVVARISRISIGFNDEKTVAQFPVTWQPKLVVPSDLTAQTGRTADQCSRRWRCELIKMLLESAVFQFAIRKNDIENLDLV